MTELETKCFAVSKRWIKIHGIIETLINQFTVGAKPGPVGISLVLLLSIGQTSVAKVRSSKNLELPNFQPGEYKVVDGPAKYCRDEKFEFYSGGSDVILLGPFIPVRTKNFAGPTDSYLPNEEGCVYKAQNSINVTGSQTNIRFEQTLVCGQETRKTLTEDTLIERERVVFDSKSTDALNSADALSFRCVWQKKVNAKK